MMNIQTQRGCALHCCYCTYPLLEGRTYRRRPPESVVEELASLERHGARYVFFVDSVFNTSVDHVTAICVFEHLPMFERVAVSRKIAGLLVPGGKFSITFDYNNPSRHARINSPDDVDKQFVEPSDLVLRGNRTFVDTGQRYLLHPFFHPQTSWRDKIRNVRHGHFRPWEAGRRKTENDYTFGALFMEKRPPAV